MKLTAGVNSSTVYEQLLRQWIYFDLTGAWSRAHNAKVGYYFCITECTCKVGSDIFVEIEVECQSILACKSIV